MNFSENLIVEGIGYLASFLVLLSFLMRNIRKLRMINSLGCITFVIYGVLLNWSWPIIVTNVAITFINAYYLFVKKQY
ncbi:uroporphyrinogen decarboxylase [Aquimarina brevivitae]|uniref:Inner membrane protein n=1 Tax=Aquimarina brevivitae TaxID=323412 RepID=A0A4Q7NXD8_9FLAO|nr:uroporphyrinogen decarboxylase [Aquimarina brevivitae]RZS91894.1 hypothetical protein EV197_2997 [Aquimarina brevivitae]